MKLCICGYGTMGKAIANIFQKYMANTFPRGSLSKDHTLYVYDPSAAAQRQARQEKFQIIPSSSSKDSGTGHLKGITHFLLCMKPQDIAEFFKFYVSEARPLEANPLFISIAAGTSLASLKGYFDVPAQKQTDSSSYYPKFARVMPNLASSIGRGAGAVAYDDTVTEGDKEFIKSCLDQLGTYLELDEGHMDAVTALSGSAPAFLFVAIDAMADAGVKMGLSRKDSLTLAAATLKDSGKLALKIEPSKRYPTHPSILKDRAAPPGGATIEGLHALEQSNGFRKALIDGILTAYKHSCALTRQTESSSKNLNEEAKTVAYHDTVNQEDKNFIKDYLKSLEDCQSQEDKDFIEDYQRLVESHMDAVTVLSGSARAFLFVAIDAMADAGVEMGLSRKDALTLAAATLRGSGELALKKELNTNNDFEKNPPHPSILKDRVASPGGTTIAGLHALERGKGFREALMDGILAAYKRSRHLARQARRSLKNPKDIENENTENN